jgi:hypothetical protein
MNKVIVAAKTHGGTFVDWTIMAKDIFYWKAYLV